MPGRTNRQRRLKRRPDPPARPVREITPLTPAQITAGADADSVAAQLSPPTIDHAKKSGEGQNVSLNPNIPDYDLLREQIIRLYRSGLPIPAIARRLGATPTLCHNTINQDQESGQGKGEFGPSALLSAQFQLAATTYTAIQQELLRRFTVVQAVRDRLIGTAQPAAEELTAGMVKALNDQMDSTIREFGRATKEYVDVIARMGVPGAAAGERDGTHAPSSTATYYRDMPVSDRDLGELDDMLRRQRELVKKMRKKQESVVEAEVVAVNVSGEPPEKS